jgi:small-conductance mechanosensitive channel
VFLLILAIVLLLERAPYLPKRVLALLAGMLLYSAIATALIWLVAYFWFELSGAPVELALAMIVLAIVLFTVIGYKGYTRAKQLEDFFEQEQTVQ